jgi:hypothetical protein
VPSFTSPGRLFPARVALDLNTGQSNIFGTAVARFNNAGLI